MKYAKSALICSVFIDALGESGYYRHKDDKLRSIMRKSKLHLTIYLLILTQNDNAMKTLRNLI